MTQTTNNNTEFLNLDRERGFNWCLMDSMNPKSDRSTRGNNKPESGLNSMSTGVKINGRIS